MSFDPLQCYIYTMSVVVVGREAVEHLLTALVLQERSRGPSGERSAMSDNIWSTLRMAVGLLGAERHLVAACDARDTDTLNRHFHAPHAGGDAQPTSQS